MRYFTPRLCTPPTPPLTPVLSDKFGGLPDGLPSGLWPRCAGCGSFQSFSAQFAHHPERLDLGKPGRRLFLFQCANPARVGMCDTWEATAGANAALVVEPEDLTTGATALPMGDLHVENELRIADWVEHTDDIEPEHVPLYLSAEGLAQMSDEELEKPGTTTQLGGVPNWIQGPDEIDHSRWRFVVQLDSYHCVETEGESVTIDAANYGGGLAYVFVERKPRAGAPLAAVFWQC